MQTIEGEKERHNSECYNRNSRGGGGGGSNRKKKKRIRLNVVEKVISAEESWRKVVNGGKRRMEWVKIYEERESDKEGNKWWKELKKRW